MATNLEKFQEIEDMMNEASPKMDDYLRVLEERNSIMSEYRSEYRKLRMASKKVIIGLENIENKNEDLNNLYGSVKDNIQEIYERLKEVSETELEVAEVQVAVKEMREVIGELKRSPMINLKALRKAEDIFRKNNIPASFLSQFIDEYKENDINVIDAAKKTLNELVQADRLYLSSFREYRAMCEDDDEVYSVYSDLVDDLLDAGFNDLSSVLEDSLPELSEGRVKRPDNKELLSVLRPIKSSGLEYFQSKNKNSDGHYYNVQFAKELAYARRALLEDREYTGTSNAFDRLKEAYKDLSDYMYERYHQLGGTPVNYHGHDNRKK